jgi:hypothetical protein
MVDLVLFDVKLIDSDAHLHWTGQSNAIPLQNLEWVASQQRKANGKQLWVHSADPGATRRTRDSIGAYRRKAGRPGDR